MTPSLQLPLLRRDLLGESPLWDASAQALYWVDARGRRVQRWCPQQGGVLQHWDAPQDLGSIALTTDANRLLLALADGFALLDLASGAVTPRAAVQHPKPPMRLNDGRCDREGRFVCGSMVLHRRDAEGSLYRLEHDGRVSTLIAGGIAVSNAICFSPDGRRLYFADSLSGLIRRWDYAVDGSLSNEQVFADTRSQGSGPDGATVDADGCLWVALVMAARLACYAPDGRLLRLLDLPVPYPSCPAFGGPALDRLYVTSIRDSGNVLRSDDPAAGALVEISGLGVRGLAEVPYRSEQPAP
ncbi:MAG: SMP-30/gluconolactonase/LRE family protein [Burkholderiaceae bacterium]|nr:SMP-30/gluconolactonase/LRE family protein [Burkholderiaceae bacterium]